jgi:hypothetical protein
LQKTKANLVPKVVFEILTVLLCSSLSKTFGRY